MELGVLDTGVLVVSRPGRKREVRADSLERSTDKADEADERSGVSERQEAVRTNGTKPRESREDDGRDGESGVPVGTEALGCVVGLGKAEELFPILLKNNFKTFRVMNIRVFRLHL